MGAARGTTNLRAVEALAKAGTFKPKGVVPVPVSDAYRTYLEMMVYPIPVIGGRSNDSAWSCYTAFHNNVPNYGIGV